MRYFAVVLVLLGPLCVQTGRSQNPSRAPRSSTTTTTQQAMGTPVNIKVETEGRDITHTIAVPLEKSEVVDLRKLIEQEFKADPSVVVVPQGHPQDFVGINVVAARVGQYIVISSVLEIATAKGEDLFLTHNVLAEHDLKSAALVVRGQFLAAKLRAVLLHKL